jgi:hypothetical protein
MHADDPSSSQRGTLSTTVLVTITFLFIVLVTVLLRYHINTEPVLTEGSGPFVVDPGKDPIPMKGAHTASIDTEPSGDREDGDLWKAIQKAFHAKRVHYSGDQKRMERGIAQKDFHRMKRLLKEYRDLGLTGDDLYAAVEDRLFDRYGPGVLKMLTGYRLLEQTMAGVDLHALSHEERFEYTYQARRAAFGEELADMLFSSREGFKELKLQEMVILEDTSLSPEEQQEEISTRRKAFKVELASLGGYVNFGDERRKNLEGKLQKRYGEAAVAAMSPEERQEAIRAMYREELPPEIIEAAEQILIKRAKRKTASN